MDLTLIFIRAQKLIDHNLFVNETVTGMYIRSKKRLSTDQVLLLVFSACIM